MKNILLIFILTMIILPIYANGGYNVYNPNETSQLSGINNEKILFIVDLSNSMNEYIGESKKIDIAVNAFATIISRLNPNVQTGLRVYGHKYGFNPLLGCRATELISPLRANNAQNLFQILSNMKATGWTPITRSLKSAVELDFAGVTGQKRIILLTDGGETCDESPCDYAINLVQSRDDIRIDVIEFAIDDPIADEQLKCTALATYGKLYKANDAESLARSLEQALDVSTDVQGTIIRK